MEEQRLENGRWSKDIRWLVKLAYLHTKDLVLSVEFADIGKTITKCWELLTETAVEKISHLAFKFNPYELGRLS